MYQAAALFVSGYAALRQGGASLERPKLSRALKLAHSQCCNHQLVAQSLSLIGTVVLDTRGRCWAVAGHAAELVHAEQGAGGHARAAGVPGRAAAPAPPARQPGGGAGALTSYRRASSARTKCS